MNQQRSSVNKTGWLRWACLAACMFTVLSQAEAQQPIGAAETLPPVASASPPRRHALIVIGLAGDEEHQQMFQETVDVWQKWLTERAGVQQADLTVLSSGEAYGPQQQSTAENLRLIIGRLATTVAPQDSVWLFLIGHGSQDARHGWFHLPGPDLHAADWAGLLSELTAGEQVFWLTHSASGSFLKPLARPQRVLVTATDDDGEVNETRFPHRLAAVMRRSEEVDAVSVLDLFRASAQEVTESFARDELAPTEHSQLDDNGDAQGTEWNQAALLLEHDENPAASLSVVDGGLAARTLIHWPSTAQER